MLIGPWLVAGILESWIILTDPRRVPPISEWSGGMPCTRHFNPGGPGGIGV